MNALNALKRQHLTLQRLLEKAKANCAKREEECADSRTAESFSRLGRSRTAVTDIEEEMRVVEAQALEAWKA